MVRHRSSDPDPLTGKRRPKWHSGFKTRKEAERARIDLLSKLDRGEYVEPSQQTLADYLVEWLAAIEHTVRPSTFDSYKRNMHNHVIAHIGSTTLARVDAVTLNGLYGMLLTSGRRRPSQTGRGYSPEIVDRAIELRGLEFSLTETAKILQTEFEEAATLNKNTLNSLLRRRAAAADWPTSNRQGPRSTNRQLHPHDPASCVQGRRPLESTRPQSGRRRRPASRWCEVRRRPRMGCRDASLVPRSVTRVERPTARAVGAARHDRHATRRSARRSMERRRPRRRPTASRPDDHASSKQGGDRRTEDGEGPTLDRPRRRHGRGPPSAPQADARGASARRPRLHRQRVWSSTTPTAHASDPTP